MKELRNTKQREEVLHSVKALCNHPSAEEVYAHVRTNNPNISKGTVYRNLNLLTDLNEISKVEMPGNEPDRFDVRILSLMKIYLSKVILWVKNFYQKKVN